MTENYWSRLGSGTARRRTFLRAGGATGLGAMGLALVGCSSGNNSSSNNSGSKPPASASAAAPVSGGASSSPSTSAVKPSVSASAGAAPVRGGTIRSGASTSVLGIDPHIETSLGLQTAARVYSTLLTYDPDKNIVGPRLAEKAPEQPSPTEFIFHLRKDAKFQNIAPVNGRAVTADDVVYSFERLRDLPQATRNGYFKTVVDKMEVIDPNTFKITTKLPYVESFSELGLGGGQGPSTQIVAREDVAKRGDLSNGGVGSGPYILDTYSKGEFTTLKRNPDYWETGIPYPDGWNTQTITDNQVLLQAYKTDKIDINGAALTKLDADDLKSDKSRVTVDVPSLSNGAFEMDVSRPPFNDPRVRQAIKIGMDRSQFINKIYYGSATPAGAIAAALEFWALPQAELKPYVTYDLKKAKDLLTAAGYPNGFDLEIISSNNPSYQNFAEIVVAELKKLNINAKQSIYDIGVFVSQYMYVGKFPSAVWVMNGYPTLITPLNYYHKNGLGSGNWWHYDNPEVTALVDQQFQEFDAPKRKSIVQDIQRKVLADWAPHMPLVDGVDYASYNKRIGGIDPLARSVQYTRYSEYVTKA